MWCLNQPQNWQQKSRNRSPISIFSRIHGFHFHNRISLPSNETHLLLPAVCDTNLENCLKTVLTALNQHGTAFNTPKDVCLLSLYLLAATRNHEQGRKMIVHAHITPWEQPNDDSRLLSNSSWRRSVDSCVKADLQLMNAQKLGTLLLCWWHPLFTNLACPAFCGC